MFKKKNIIKLKNNRVMKKIFTLIAAIATTLNVLATDYTGTLTVNVNGEGGSQDATVSITENSGKYTLSIDNFMLGEDTPVGKIVVADLAGTTKDGVTTIHTSQTIMMEAGSDPNIPEDEWLGMMLNELGGVPILMAANFDGKNMFTSISIDMTNTLGQMIDVTFDTGSYLGYTQIPNSGFEDWYSLSKKGYKSLFSTGTISGNEPNHWHSFLCHTGATSTLEQSATGVKTYKSTDVRPGSKGQYSAKITPSMARSIALANGTITTGRLYAGSMQAADATGNYAFLKLSDTNKDGNGDPFYVELKARPDSIALWYKFTSNNTGFPYASVSAILTNGNEVHDPNIGSYASNVVAHASNTTLDAQSQWKRISMPFVYNPSLNIVNNKGAVTGTAEGTASEVKAILVTISTNATPAGGDKNDVLYVDDLELIYNPKTESAGVSDPKIVIAGKTIEIAPNTYEYEIAFDALSGAAQRVIRKAEGKTVVTPDVIEVLDGEGNELLATSSVADTDEGAVASVIVYSDDLKNKATYTVNMTGNVTGINDVVTEAEAVSTTYYNLLGVQSNTPFSGINVVVTTYSDGTRAARKVIK